MPLSPAHNIVMSMAAGALAMTLLTAQAPAEERLVPAENVERLANARDIFQQNCAVCHGYDGIPLVAGAANFSVGERLEKGDEELLEIIARGKNDMPPWEDMLGEQERVDALAYVRVLAGDLVFEDRCAYCHDSAVPLVPDIVPAAGELVGNPNPPDVCLGSSVEADMTEKELVDVIKFIRGISK